MYRLFGRAATRADALSPDRNLDDVAGRGNVSGCWRRLSKSSRRHSFVILFGTLSLVGSTAVQVETMATASASGPTTPPFTQCPSIGADSTCGALIDVTSSGTTLITDSSKGPYDGSDDALFGVQNDTASSIGSITIATHSAIFGFDGDGICTYAFTGDGYCSSLPSGSSGYEGPSTSFSSINPAQTTGTVNFSGGLAPGSSTYFSLENAISGTYSINTGVNNSKAATGNGSGLVAVHPTGCNKGKPVNCASGDFWHTFTDVSVPGQGPALDLTRTYNSLNASTLGIFGYGWSSSYDMHLVVNSDSSVTITAEDGSQVTATPSGSSYTMPSWADSTLTASGGTYTYVRHQTQTFTFNSAGQLTSITDPDGLSTTLSYSSGKLSTVTDSAGRTLTFAYGTNGLVSQVTDPSSRSVTYAYSSSQLTSVTDRASRVTSFTYDTSGNHLVLTMTSPNGQPGGPNAGATLTNTYDSSARVLTQTDRGRTRDPVLLQRRQLFDVRRYDDDHRPRRQRGDPAVSHWDSLGRHQRCGWGQSRAVEQLLRPDQLGLDVANRSQRSHDHEHLRFLGKRSDGN